MDKLKKDNQNVNGGYVELEFDLKNNKNIIRAFDNDTNEQLAESVLYNAKDSDINRLISEYQKFDKDYHSNKQNNQ